MSRLEELCEEAMQQQPGAVDIDAEAMDLESEEMAQVMAAADAGDAIARQKLGALIVKRWSTVLNKVYHSL